MVGLEELKIGNYVILHIKKGESNKKVVCTVSGIDEDGSITLRSLSEEKKKYTCSPSDIEPVNLTVKFIKEIGFEKDYYQEFKYIVDEDDMTEISICYREKKFYLQISYLDENDNDLSQLLEYRLVNFKQLHQLQNIYFNLTGKLLTVSNLFKEE